MSNREFVWRILVSIGAGCGIAAHLRLTVSSFMAWRSRRQ